MSDAKKKVLILCTGNSCRSQMAEVIWNELGEGHWEAHSAGSKPAGYVHPMAIRLLDEFSMPTEGLRSKSVDEFKDQPFDIVVSVCDNAKNECPTLPGATQVLHWPFQDPNDAEGSEEEKMEVFRGVADLIKARINAYLVKIRGDECA